MPADPFTPAELEAGARAVGRARHFVDTDGYPSLRIGTGEEDASVVLAAAAPLIAARVRAETAEGIARDLQACTWQKWRDRAAAIARDHRTTPDGGDPDV